MRKIICGATVILMCAVVGAALGSSSIDVAQKGKEFNPGEVAIAPGTKVRFINDDAVTHNVYANGNGLDFNLGSQAPGDAKEVVFDKPGSFEVHCAIHPKMALTVNVK